jgi:hypothetical protein
MIFRWAEFSRTTKLEGERYKQRIELISADSKTQKREFYMKNRPWEFTGILKGFKRNDYLNNSVMSSFCFCALLL